MTNARDTGPYALDASAQDGPRSTSLRPTVTGAGHRHRWRAWALPLWLMLDASGCAPQNTTDYRGDALFSMVGRVEVPLSASGDQDLVPAVVFMGADEEVVSIVSGDVSGEFPAEFRLDLYAPPPAQTLGGFGHADLPGEPRHTIGYISAVANNHIPMMYYASVLVGNGERYDADGGYHMYEASSGDGAHRGIVTAFCPGETFEEQSSEPVCGIVDRSGEPMFVGLASDPMFAGAADNFAVAYLESPAPADSAVARRFGSAAGLAAGYHLLRMQPYAAATEEAKRACQDDALDAAVSSYNTAHGTRLDPSSIQYTPCSGSDCGPNDGHTRGLRGAWYRGMAEEGCLPGPELTAVDADDAGPLSLKVSPGTHFVNVAFGSI